MKIITGMLYSSDPRSKDDVSLFVDEGVIHTELSIGFNNEYLNKIKECIKNCYSDAINQSWYNTLMHTAVGQIILAVTAALIFISTAFVIKLTKPIEYKR